MSNTKQTPNLKRVNKKILKLLTGLYPDFVTLGYLYERRSWLAQQDTPKTVSQDKSSKIAKGDS